MKKRGLDTRNEIQDTRSSFHLQRKQTMEGPHHMKKRGLDTMNEIQDTCSSFHLQRKWMMEGPHHMKKRGLATMNEIKALSFQYVGEAICYKKR